ncbi:MULTISPECIES: nuclear transport factor 2 family protein [Henriciella]|uniref:nuclear transport factor 2 family protein n=1 Tax=Henriciella TaxID=453849 RepID=UPI0035197C92
MKYTITVAAFGLIAACSEPASNGSGDAQAPAETAQTATTEDMADDISTVDTVKTVYDGFATGDIALATSNFAESIVWTEAENSPYADQNPYEGTDEIVTGLFARLGGEWEYFNAVPSEFIAEGNRVVSLGRYTAKHGETGKEMDIPFVHVWTVEDGEITSFQQYTDTLAHSAVMTADPE